MPSGPVVSCEIIGPLFYFQAADEYKKSPQKGLCGDFGFDQFCQVRLECILINPPKTFP